MENKVIFRSLIIALASILCSGSAFGLTKAIKKLVQYETGANAASTRTSAMIMLPHVEIPIEMVGLDFAERLDPKIAKSLVIEKNGKKYVRWILNPEDTKWGKELLAHFATKGLVLDVQYHFQGYQTASRSYITEDPTTGAEFSVKSSTDVTGGAWRDKKQPVGEAVDGRLTSDFMFEQNQKRPFENFTVMDEPAILKLDAIDQAVVIRDLGPIKNPRNKTFLVPGFSVLHEDLGKQIALQNGSADPQAFWTEHYIKVAGRALGELAARTGIQFDSPHSQNFLVELDANYRPTGKLVLRDMSDLYLDVTYLNALLGEKNKLVENFTQTDNKHDYIAAGFGPLHGNKSPSWVSTAQYSAWKDVFFNEFDSTFKTISGYDLNKLRIKRYQNSQYFSSDLRLGNNTNFRGLFNSMNKLGIVKKPGGFCKALFTEIYN